MCITTRNFIQTIQWNEHNMAAYLTCQSLSGLPLFIRRKGDIPPVCSYQMSIESLVYLAYVD